MSSNDSLVKITKTVTSGRDDLFVEQRGWNASEREKHGTFDGPT